MTEKSGIHLCCAEVGRELTARPSAASASHLVPDQGSRPQHCLHHPPPIYNGAGRARVTRRCCSLTEIVEDVHMAHSQIIQAGSFDLSRFHRRRTLYLLLFDVIAVRHADMPPVFLSVRDSGKRTEGWVMLDQAFAPYRCLQFRELYRSSPFFRQRMDVRSHFSEVNLFVYRADDRNSRGCQE